jgi:hypothetical protein
LKNSSSDDQEYVSFKVKDKYEQIVYNLNLITPTVFDYLWELKSEEKKENEALEYMKLEVEKMKAA